MTMDRPSRCWHSTTASRTGVTSRGSGTSTSSRWRRGSSGWSSRASVLAELALRFSYGGLDEARIEIVPELAAALDRGLELTEPGGELVFLPTYTAMLGLQRVIADRGYARPYWERVA